MKIAEYGIVVLVSSLPALLLFVVYSVSAIPLGLKLIATLAIVGFSMILIGMALEISKF